MELIYSLIIILAFTIELSTKVNTNNIIKKISLALIIVGCLVHLAHRDNFLIEIGLLGYFSADFIIHLMRKHNRRATDETISGL